jgi:hypothetical protein
MTNFNDNNIDDVKSQQSSRFITCEENRISDYQDHMFYYFNKGGKAMAILTCKQLCKIKGMLANLKCPACFRAKIDFCEEETDNIAECQSCGCKFDLGPGFPEYGME